MAEGIKLVNAQGAGFVPPDPKAYDLPGPQRSASESLMKGMDFINKYVGKYQEDMFHEGVFDKYANQVDEDWFVGKDSYDQGVRYAAAQQKLPQLSVEIQDTVNKHLAEGKSVEDTLAAVRSKQSELWSIADEIHDRYPKAADSITSSLVKQQGKATEDVAMMRIQKRNDAVVAGNQANVYARLQQLMNERDGDVTSEDIQNLYTELAPVLQESAISMGVQDYNSYAQNVWGSAIQTTIMGGKPTDKKYVNFLNNLKTAMQDGMKTGAVPIDMGSKLLTTAFQRIGEVRHAIEADIYEFISTDGNLSTQEGFNTAFAKLRHYESVGGDPMFIARSKVAVKNAFNAQTSAARLFQSGGRISTDKEANLLRQAVYNATGGDPAKMVQAEAVLYSEFLARGNHEYASKHLKNIQNFLEYSITSEGKFSDTADTALRATFSILTMPDQYTNEYGHTLNGLNIRTAFRRDFGNKKLLAFLDNNKDMYSAQLKEAYELPPQLAKTRTDEIISSLNQRWLTYNNGSVPKTYSETPEGAFTTKVWGFNIAGMNDPMAVEMSNVAKNNSYAIANKAASAGITSIPEGQEEDTLEALGILTETRQGYKTFSTVNLTEVFGRDMVDNPIFDATITKLCRDTTFANEDGSIEVSGTLDNDEAFLSYDPVGNVFYRHYTDANDNGVATPITKDSFIRTYIELKKQSEKTNEEVAKLSNVEGYAETNFANDLRDSDIQHIMEGTPTGIVDREGFGSRMWNAVFGGTPEEVAYKTAKAEEAMRLSKAYEAAMDKPADLLGRVGWEGTPEDKALSDAYKAAFGFSDEPSVEVEKVPEDAVVEAIDDEDFMGTTYVSADGTPLFEGKAPDEVSASIRDLFLDYIAGSSIDSGISDDDRKRARTLKSVEPEALLSNNAFRSLSLTNWDNFQNYYKTYINSLDISNKVFETTGIRPNSGQGKTLASYKINRLGAPVEMSEYDTRLVNPAVSSVSIGGVNLEGVKGIRVFNDNEGQHIFIVPEELKKMNTKEQAEFYSKVFYNYKNKAFNDLRVLNLGADNPSFDWKDKTLLTTGAIITSGGIGGAIPDRLLGVLNQRVAKEGRFTWFTDSATDKVEATDPYANPNEEVTRMLSSSGNLLEMCDARSRYFKTQYAPMMKDFKEYTGVDLGAQKNDSAFDSVFMFLGDTCMSSSTDKDTAYKVAFWAMQGDSEMAYWLLTNGDYKEYNNSSDARKSLLLSDINTTIEMARAGLFKKFFNTEGADWEATMAKNGSSKYSEPIAVQKSRAYHYVKGQTN